MDSWKSEVIWLSGLCTLEILLLRESLEKKIHKPHKLKRPIRINLRYCLQLNHTKDRFLKVWGYLTQWLTHTRNFTSEGLARKKLTQTSHTPCLFSKIRTSRSITTSQDLDTISDICVRMRMWWFSDARSCSPYAFSRQFQCCAGSGSGSDPHKLRPAKNFALGPGPGPDPDSDPQTRKGPVGPANTTYVYVHACTYANIYVPCFAWPNWMYDGNERENSAFDIRKVSQHLQKRKLAKLRNKHRKITKNNTK